MILKNRPERQRRRKRGRPRKLGEVQGFALRLPVQLHRQLRRHAIATGVSLNDLVVSVLLKWWAHAVAARRHLANEG